MNKLKGSQALSNTLSLVYLMISASFIPIISEPREPTGLLAVQPTPPGDTLHIQQ